MNRCRILFIALLFSAATALAVPQQIDYQGSLARPDGTPLDTTVTMTFRLYTLSAGGTTLWTETRPAVTSAGGLFAVPLGSVTILPDTVFNRAEVWLGLTVGNNTEMTPRVRIVSVGYSYRVGTVDGASGLVNGEWRVAE